jgi:hypothetical protein
LGPDRDTEQLAEGLCSAISECFDNGNNRCAVARKGTAAIDCAV